MGAGNLGGKPFRENHRPAAARPTPKTPNGKRNHHLATMCRKVCQSTPITAVHLPCKPTASRTGGCGAPCKGVNKNTVSRQFHLLNTQAFRQKSLPVQCHRQPPLVAAHI